MEPQSAKGVLKIMAPPKETFIEMGDEKITCWLHPLTGREKLLVEAQAQESLKAAADKGLTDQFCFYSQARAEICQRLFFSLRKTGEKTAERFFQTEDEVAFIPIDEANRLALEYKEAFVCSGEEIKNYYRAKLGPASETSSTSPSVTVAV